MRNIILTIFLLLPAFVAFSQIDRSIPPEPETPKKLDLGKMTSFQLENGLKIFLVNRPGYTKFTMQVNIEQPDITDDYQECRSILTSAYYKSITPTLPEGKRDSLIDQLGATMGVTINGGYIKGMKRDAEELLSIYTDLLFNPVITVEDLQKATEKYLESEKKKQDVPKSGKLEDIGVILTDSLLRGSVLNKVNEEKVLNYDTLSINDVTAYKKKRIVATNTLIIVIGDFSKTECEKLVKKCFGSWEAGEPFLAENEYKNSSSLLRNRKIYVIDNPLAVQSKVSFHWNIRDAFPYFDKATELELMDEIFGSSQNSYIYKNLRLDKGFCYYIGSSIGPTIAGGNAFINTSVRNEVTDLAIENIIFEMLRMRNTMVSDLDFKIAKGSLIGEFSRSVSGIATISYISFAMAKDKYNLPDSYLQERVQNIYNVSKKDVREMAMKYINPFECLVLIDGKVEDLKHQNLERFGEIHYIDKEGKEIKL